MKDYQVIIGLEVHVQLLTASKLFCGCRNLFNPDEPNVQTCPVCLGLPGSLPVLNRRAFELSIRTALALNCEIASFTKWDRKQYFYPDLPKAYQISQYDLPFSHSGHVDVTAEDADTVRVRINRVHLEEDAGKNVHDDDGHGGGSRIDLNRAGTPLLEIVSEPDLRSARQARKYLEDLRLLLTFLEVSDCNMQEGSLRCDANVNLSVTSKDGTEVRTPIVEIKNMNSFSSVELAIEHEADRQFAEWQRTGHTFGDLPKQTRGWDADRGLTFAQRGKEDAADYRYFPDPDLVPVVVTPEEVDALRPDLAALPAARMQRYQSELALSEYDAQVIVERGPAFAAYFEAVCALAGDGKLAANWSTQEVLRELHERGIEADEFVVTPDVLGTLLQRVLAKSLSTSGARQVFERLRNMPATSADDIDRLIDELGLQLVTGGDELSAAIASTIADNSEAVSDFLKGKQAAVGPLIGQVMRQIKGADPATVRSLLIEAMTATGG